MNWFAKLFGKTNATAEKSEYFESDNVGTRFDSADQAGAHRLSTRAAGTAEPCIDYCFGSAQAARSAMLEIPCIKVAKDTDKLISTEILKFGVFKRYEDADDAFIALLEGKGLTYDLWIVARDTFERCGGRRVAEVEPPRTHAQSKKPSGNAQTVIFSHEETRIVSGLPATYRYHTAPDKASAVAFLQQNPVNRASFFLVVKTPDGVFCRDIQGFFEQ